VLLAAAKSEPYRAHVCAYRVCAWHNLETSAQTERLIHALGAKHPLCLGGPAGDGILEVRVVPA